MTPSPPRRIYVSDLDGTLLRNNATLSDYARRELTGLLERGLAFTVATARGLPGIREALGDLPLTLPVIAINGAFISDYHTGRHYAIRDIAPSLAEEIYRRILRHDCVPFVSTFDGVRDRLYFNRLANPGMEWYHNDRQRSGDQRLTCIHDLTHPFGRDHIVSLSVIGAREQLWPLAEELENELPGQLENHFFENPYSPPWWWLTIHDRRACKSHAVRTLVEQAGYDYGGLVVFGDSLNDVKLFRSAPHAVAVANATEDVKRYAHETIGPNEDDSVVAYLLRRHPPA